MIITVVNDISRAAAVCSRQAVLGLKGSTRAALYWYRDIAELKWWNIAARMEVETLLRRRFIFGHEFCIIVGSSSFKAAAI